MAACAGLVSLEKILIPWDACGQVFIWDPAFYWEHFLHLNNLKDKKRNKTEIVLQSECYCVRAHFTKVFF